MLRIRRWIIQAIRFHIDSIKVIVRVLKRNAFVARFEGKLLVLTACKYSQITFRTKENKYDSGNINIR